MDYAEKLKDPRWQKKRLEILERDNWTCKHCGEKEKTLHVHHLFYLKDKDPWEINSGLLITLCEDCHLTEKDKLEKGEGGSIIEDYIGHLLREIWDSGYSLSDLINIQQAIFYCKKRPSGALMDFSLEARYLEDYDVSE